MDKSVVAIILSAVMFCFPTLTVADLDQVHANGNGAGNGTGDKSTAQECGGLPPELQAIVTAMETPGRHAQSLLRRGEMTPLTPMMQRLEVTLHPIDQVSLVAVRSGKMNEWSETYAGLLRFGVPKDGVYRISASSSSWIDVLDSQTAVARIRPNHRLHGCGQVRKSIEFQLKAGTSYWLELSGSKYPAIALMISAGE